MSDDRKREIVIAPSSALAVASRLAERTLAARAARAELVPGGAAPTELVPIRGRTLVVGADGAGAYPTIGSAVAEARDGDRILVRPGIYRESVTIDRSIEIAGDGDVDAIVVVSDDAPCFVLSGTTSRLAGLTLRAGGPTYGIEGGRVWLRDLYWARVLATPAIEGGSVLVSGGSVVLDGLVLAESHGVWAEEGASLTIRNSLIRDCRRDGILIRDGASATIEDNEILRNAGNGIWVSGLGTGPVIRRNKIHNNRDDGIYVADRQTGTIEDNEVYGNGGFVGHAIDVSRTGSALMIRRNHIYDCGTGSGIRVDDASPTIVDNELFGDVLVEHTINAAIMVWSATSAPVIRRNRVHDWPGDGIAVVLGAAGTIEANDIFGNGGSGINIRKEGSAPVVRRNSIHDGRGFGIWVMDGANGTIEDNEIFRNQGGGIMVSGRETEPTIRENRIHDNLSCGIQVSVGAAGSIVDNRIIGNRSDPIRIDPGASPHLARNVIG